jgi:hypothetical protein
MRVTTRAALPLVLAAAAAATLGYLGPAHPAPDSAPTRLAGTLTPALDTTATRSDLAVAWPTGVARSGARWCALSPTGDPGQAASGTADRDTRYERADPRRVARQPTDPC